MKYELYVTNEDVLALRERQSRHIKQRQAKLAQTIYFIIPIMFKFE
jgi:hypothetical protein